MILRDEADGLAFNLFIFSQYQTHILTGIVLADGFHVGKEVKGKSIKDNAGGSYYVWNFEGRYMKRPDH